MDSRRFLGTHTPRMDDKGRVTIPARYREDFKAGALLVRGQDRCLLVFTPDGFERFADSVINADIDDPQARGNQRYILANTEEQTPDVQGRITIPPRMREYAELDKDVVVVGAGRRMEIWNPERWTSYETDQAERATAPGR